MGLVIGSASKPQWYRADGKRWAVKTRFKPNAHGGGHGLAAERIAGLAGALIGAPVPCVELMEIDAPFLPTSVDMAGEPVPPVGLHHASLWRDGYGGRAELAYVAENRPALGALHILYLWLPCTGDHQLIYQNDPPHGVLSVDHSCFLPGGPDWTAATLAGGMGVLGDQPFFDAAGLTDADREAALHRLRAVSREQIATLAASVPREWGISVTERIAVAECLEARCQLVIQRYSVEEAAHDPV